MPLWLHAGFGADAESTFGSVGQHSWGVHSWAFPSHVHRLHLGKAWTCFYDTSHLQVRVSATHTVPATGLDGERRTAEAQDPPPGEPTVMSKRTPVPGRVQPEVPGEVLAQRMGLWGVLAVFPGDHEAGGAATGPTRGLGSQFHSPPASKPHTRKEEPG